MGIMDDLLKKAEDEIRDGRWVEAAVRRGEEEILPMIPPGRMQTAAGRVLSEARLRGGELGQAGASGFALVVSYLAMGRVDEARLVHLRSRGSTHDERMAALDATSASVRSEKGRRDESWAAVRRFGEFVLEQLGPAALPFLLSIL